MKFTPKRLFKHGYLSFEVGNTYDSAVHGLTDDEVKSFHAAGWSEVEGMGPAPEPNFNVSVKPKKAVHATVAKDVGATKRG